MDQIKDDRRTNWFWIDNEIVDRFGSQIGAYGLTVYTILARFANNKTRVAFPAIPTLMALSGLSRNTVLSTIKCLESTQPPLITVKMGGRDVERLGQPKDDINRNIVRLSTLNF